MKLNDIRRELDLRPLTPEVEGDRDVEWGHASDLLSDVLANAPDRGVLVTLQVHLNVIAVALHAELAAVIFSSGLVPEESVRAKAAAEGLALFSSRQTTFDVVGRLYALGIRGKTSR
jgi:hypothetical protein